MEFPLVPFSEVRSPLVSQEGDAKVARLRVAEKLWNDIAPFVIGSKAGDIATVELESGQIMELVVQTNQAMSDLQNEAKHAIRCSNLTSEKK